MQGRRYCHINVLSGARLLAFVMLHPLPFCPQACHMCCFGMQFLFAVTVMFWSFLLVTGDCCLQFELFCLQWESVCEALKRTVNKEDQL